MSIMFKSWHKYFSNRTNYFYFLKTIIASNYRNILQYATYSKLIDFKNLTNVYNHWK